jgi:hypothetical protein
MDRAGTSPSLHLVGRSLARWPVVLQSPPERAKGVLARSRAPGARRKFDTGERSLGEKDSFCVLIFRVQTTLDYQISDPATVVLCPDEGVVGDLFLRVCSRDRRVLKVGENALRISRRGSLVCLVDEILHLLALQCP